MRGVVLRAIALYVTVVGVAVLVVRIGGGGVWPSWIAFASGAAGVASITVALFVPRLRRLRKATAAAEELAAGHFEARFAARDAEFGPLASALNAAGAHAGRTIDALTQERAHLEALLNASSDAIVAIDRPGAVVYLNDAARRVFPSASDVSIGRPFIEVVRDHDLNDLLVAAAQRGERSVRVVAYGQAQRWLQATAVPIERAGAWAALAVFHDLTEVRRLEGMRRDFISNVSHELRTPLAGIRAAAETLEEGALDDRPAAVEFLGHILRETDRMTQLVAELLELSRIESGAAPLHFVPLDAAALVADTVERFAQQAERAGLTLAARTPAADPLPILGDGERLERALGNLVANAIKFTPSGGSVILAAEAADGDVAISVADTGSGIEPEQQARVFERFYKADPGRGDGTGLGLAIVKHIALAHEGTVSVESRPGRGSTFTMRLPRR